MLERVRLADQWHGIESELPTDWREARLRLQISDPSRASRGAALLGPAGAGRSGDALVLGVSRAGGTSPFALRRLLERLDSEGIGGRLELVASEVSAGVTGPAHTRTSFVVDWDALMHGLPDDWSDLHVEAELESSDHVARAALLLAPANPTRYGDTRRLRFRVARSAGYGASPGMTRRCLERLDEDAIRGTVRILRALSETNHVQTQGPVWYVEGRAV